MPKAGRSALFIVTDYFPSTGGPTTEACAFARELTNRGWTIHVATRRLSRAWLRSEVVDGVLIHRAGRPGYGKLAKVADLLETWWWLLRTRRQFTFVQAFMDPDYALVASAAGLGRRTVMKWATLGDPERYIRAQPLSGLRVRILRRCMHTALTAAMAEEVRQCGIYVDAIIPVPTDSARFQPASSAERAEAKARLGISSEVTIVFTGHLEPRKGVDRLLQAFGAIVSRGASVHLLVVGGNHGNAPDLRRELDRFVRSGSLENSVTFSGVVRDVLPYLHASDIFCLPSTREGMSNSLVEAMACGLACVAPASAGGDDLLSGGAGVVPPSNSPEDLVTALMPLIGDSELRGQLGKAATSRVQAYGLSAVVDAYEELYAQIPLRRSGRAEGRRAV